MVDAFHVSQRIYLPGDVVPPGESTFIAANAADTLCVRAETNLEAARPGNAPARRSSRFAYENDGATYDFWHKQERYRQLTPHFYRVRIAARWKVPTVLVDHIYLLLQEGQDCTRAAREYWAPTDHWRCCEYLADSFEVLEEVNPPASKTVGLYQDNWFLDYDQARRHWSR